MRPSAERMVERVKEMRQTVMRVDKGSIGKSPSSVRRFIQNVRNKIPFMSNSRPTSPEPFAKGSSPSSADNTYLRSAFGSSPPIATRRRFASSETRSKEVFKPALLPSPESHPGLIRGNDAGRVLFPDVRQHGSQHGQTLPPKGSVSGSSCQSLCSSKSN